MGDERDVELAAPHLFDQIDRRLADDRQLDARIGAREARHDLRQEPVRIIVRRADPHMAFQAGIVEGGQRLAVHAEHAAGMDQQPLAVLRQPVGPAVLLEELLAQPFLQPPHLHGDGRLGAEHLLGGAREAARVGDGDECLQAGRGRAGRP
jgi:hypothetical protein